MGNVQYMAMALPQRRAPAGSAANGELRARTRRWGPAPRPSPRPAPSLHRGRYRCSHRDWL